MTRPTQTGRAQVAAPMLCVHAHPGAPDGSVHVRFRIALPGRDDLTGTFQVWGVGLTSDPACAAELAALETLLLERMPAGTDESAHALTIEVSRGAIRRLARGTSAKRDLIPRCRFLWTRFAHARLRVNKRPAWLAEPAPDAEPINAGGSASQLVDGVDIPGLGRVQLTRHALNRYRDRAAPDNTATAWQGLTRLLSGPLTPVTPPPQVRLHKRLKYTTEERILRGRDDWHFVLVPARTRAEHVLVTVFRRAPAATR